MMAMTIDLSNCQRSAVHEHWERQEGDHMAKQVTVYSNVG